MLEPTTENIWYVITAAGDEAIIAHIAALCEANKQYHSQYLERRQGHDVDEALPFPHAEQVLETIQNIREQQPDLWQQGNVQSQPVQDATSEVRAAADKLRQAWIGYRDSIVTLGTVVVGENPVIDA